MLQNPVRPLGIQVHVHGGNAEISARVRVVAIHIRACNLKGGPGGGEPAGVRLFRPIQQTGDHLERIDAHFHRLAAGAGCRGAAYRVRRADERGHRRAAGHGYRKGCAAVDANRARSRTGGRPPHDGRVGVRHKAWRRRHAEGACRRRCVVQPLLDVAVISGGTIFMFNVT